MSGLLMVTVQIDGAHPQHTDHPLLPGDVLGRDGKGGYTKLTGLCVCGFRLTADQEATLEPVEGRIVMCGWDELEPAESRTQESER
jgi:hypothetical protein